jgi:hypothetical protein
LALIKHRFTRYVFVYATRRNIIGTSTFSTKAVECKMKECEINKRRKEGNWIENKRDCRRKKKRRDKQRRV